MAAAASDAPRIYDPWKCMKHPEAAEGTPQVFFWNEQTGATEWYRPVLHQFEPDDVPAELAESSTPGPHLLAAAAPHYMFTAHAEEQSVRQHRADGSRVRTVRLRELGLIESDGPLSILAMSCGETERAEGEYTVAVVVQYSDVTGGIKTQQTRLLRLVVRHGEEDGPVDAFVSTLDPDVISCASLPGKVLTGGSRGELHTWEAVGEVTTPLRTVLNAKKDFTARTQPSPSPISVVAAYDGHVLCGDTMGRVRVWKGGESVCFPLAGVQCGEVREGEVTAIHVQEDRLYVARLSKIFVFKWGDVTIPLRQAMAREAPEPILVFALSEEQQSRINGVTGLKDRVFSSQSDGSVAVWPPAKDLELEMVGEDGYEYDLGEQDSFERYETYAAGVVQSEYFGGGVWCCTATSTHVRIYSAS